VINNLLTMETSGFYDLLRTERPLSTSPRGST
jgi:hypothetical protein